MDVPLLDTGGQLTYIHEQFDDDVLPLEEEIHMNDEEAQQLYDQFQHEDSKDNEFDSILDHKLTTPGLTQ